MPKTPYQKFLADCRKKGYTKSPFNYDGEGRIIKDELAENKREHERKV